MENIKYVYRKYENFEKSWNPSEKHNNLISQLKA